MPQRKRKLRTAEEILGLPPRPLKSAEEILGLAPPRTPPQAPTPPAPAPGPAPGFLGNLEIGGRRALATATDAGIALNEAVSAALAGDFTPLKQMAELAGRGVAPFVAAAFAGPQAAPARFLGAQEAQAPRIEELTRQRNERIAQIPELYSTQVVNQEERERLDALAALDPSMFGKVTRRGTEVITGALPAIATGVATGGSIPAVATVVGLQSLAQPETLIPNVALAATPIPLGKVVAPIVRRIKVGRAAAEIPAPAGVAPGIATQIRRMGAVAEQPRISTETPLPGVEAPPSIPTPAATSQTGLNLAGMGQAIGENFRKMLRDSVAKTGKLPSVERNSAIGKAYESAVAQGAPRNTDTLDAILSGGQVAARNPLQSAVRKLGTDSVEEIAEMIANANRRFNKTVSAPGVKKRPITPAERQSAIEDYNRIKTLTKEESDALAEVLPERAYAPVQEGSPTARTISDIPLSEPHAQLDANLRQLKAFFGSDEIVRESKLVAAVGNGADDPAIVRTADLGLETVPVPVRPAGVVPVSRRVSVDDISLGSDTLSKGRMFGVQESLKGGVKGEQKGVPLKQQTESITVTPDPNRPGRFIVEDDGNHRVALLKLQGVKDDIPVKSFETPAQTASIRTTVGPRAGEVAPLEVAVAEEATAVPVSRLRKALNLWADIYQIPRSIMSSADISAPFRQGAILTLPPSRWGKAYKATVEMFRALVPDRPTSIKGAVKAQFQPKTERYQRMVDSIANDPDAVIAQDHGLKLTSQTREGIRKAEEEFVSRTADRIPIVRESQQAYTMYVDNIRLNTFKLYKQAIDRQGFTPEQVKRGYEAASRWINIGSGRGSFGEKVDRAMDALNFFIFSPRFLASRIQVLDPRTYLRNARTAEGRVVLKMQMSEMAQFTAMVGATLLLAKAAGFKVGTNPERADFLRISLGNYHYDGLAGLQPVMRLIYNVGADALRAARGEKPVEGKTALDVGARFLRGKLAPVPSFFTDFLSRKTFEGKPFNLTDAAVERLSPMMWGDMIEAYQREGLGGPLMLSPGAVGFGAQYYEPDPMDAAIEQRPELLNELTRLQIRLGDPRRKPDESDELYKGRQEAIARLYSRFAVSLMSSRAYANQTEEFKKEAFDILHERILNAVNMRDRRIGNLQPEAIINAVRRAEIQGKLRQKRIARRSPL